MTEDSTMTGIYTELVYPDRKKKGTPIYIRFRNFEIDCPECKQYIATQKISVVRAEFGVKMACKMCRHQFTFRHQEEKA